MSEARSRKKNPRWLPRFLVVGFSLAFAGCTPTKNAKVPPPPFDMKTGTAEQFLKWSMDHYASATTFEVKGRWQMTPTNDEVSNIAVDAKPGTRTPGFHPTTQDRSIEFESPNKFRVESTLLKSPFVTIICDGKQMSETSATTPIPSISPAPSTISMVRTEKMTQPEFAGTILYQFFGGASNFNQLVDSSKGTIEFGQEMTNSEGEKERSVTFYGRQGFGHVIVLIGEITGWVYQIRNDMESVSEISGAAPSIRVAMTSKESYDKPVKDDPIPSSMFDLALATAKKEQPEETDDSDTPALKAGTLAPDFTVTGGDGKKLKLSSLRGRVVLIDFWATWCPPCREGLPVTAEFSRLPATKGLTVLAISDEDQETVKKFLAEQTYKLDAFVDSDQSASNSYKVEAIPATFIIDKEGKISSAFVGLQERHVLVGALRKAGVDVR